MKNGSKNKKKRIFISVFSILLAHLLIIFPASTITVYEVIFNRRYKTVSYLEFSAEDYDGLLMERSDFQSDGVTLAGYKYYKLGQEVKGVIVLAHGMGGGGHNSYMPFIDLFTSSGYYVFAYDARGTDRSGGDAVEGLPQGVICLSDALDHAATIKEYKDLPVALLGHSWGGYSVGSALYLHPEVKAAVIVAGFNESEDLLAYESGQVAGVAAKLFLPYLQLYERVKFGKTYSEVSAMQGLESSTAGVLIVHSKDDENVPTRYGYDKFYEAFGTLDRFRFVLYEDKGHTDLFYSDNALSYRKELEAAYAAYLEKSGKKDCDEVLEEFMKEHLDKKRYFEPDPLLSEQFLDLFDTYCQDISNP